MFVHLNDRLKKKLSYDTIILQTQKHCKIIKKLMLLDVKDRRVALEMFAVEHDEEPPVD